MLRKSVRLFGFALFACETVFGDINTVSLLENLTHSSVSEGVLIPFSDYEQKEWKLAFQEVAENGSWIMEWTPQNEEVTNWSKLIQIQFLPASQFGGKTISAANFSSAFLELIRKEFPSVVGSVVPKGVNGTIIEWSLPKATHGEQAQNELARIISTPEGIYRIAFTVKEPSMAKQIKDAWFDRLSKITLVSQ